MPRKAPDPAGRRRLPDAQRDFGLGAGIADGHAVDAAGTQSGRITCRVTREGPTVTGGLRHSGAGFARHAGPVHRETGFRHAPATWAPQGRKVHLHHPDAATGAP